MAYIPQPPPVNDLGNSNSALLAKNGTWPVFSADKDAGATPGLTTKGTLQMGSPGITGGPDFPASVPVTSPAYTPPPNPGTMITDEISGASVPMQCWDPNVGKGIGQATLTALQSQPLTLINGASNTVLLAVLRWRGLLGL
jgi:hypothetical protein